MPERGAAPAPVLAAAGSLRPGPLPQAPAVASFLDEARSIAAHLDNHIERVWPMRSPPTGPVEDTSSALFHSGRSGHPPAHSLLVGGLRMSQEFEHDTVMVREVVDLFASVPPGVVVDATVGGGGHAAAILDAHPHLGIVGLDRDPLAVRSAREALARFGGRATVVQRRFDELSRALDELPGERPAVVGALFDLGVSSPQLDTPERGFSYRRDAPLDMRMDPTSEVTAEQVVNTYDEETLVAMFAENGETRFARRIARAVIAGRPIATTGQLADIVKTAIPAAARRTGGHPARRVFQAIRIAVNEELDQLARALIDAMGRLSVGGRLVVISYHSGEDRLVKSAFTLATTGGCVCPPQLPCVCGATAEFRLVKRGAMRPSAAEVEANHRAESARLRVVERSAVAHSGAATGDVA